MKVSNGKLLLSALEVVLGEEVDFLVSFLEKFVLHEVLVLIYFLVNLHGVLAFEGRFDFSLGQGCPVESLKPGMTLQLLDTLFRPQPGSRLTNDQLIDKINSLRFVPSRQLSLFEYMLLRKNRISYLVPIIPMVWPLNN